MMRLQKYMAAAGVASRRASEKLIAEGKVKVNGRVVTEMGTQINEYKDVVHVRDKRVTLNLKEEKKYYVINKPRGYLSTSKDERGRKTVLELVDTEERLYPVGRLDQNTSGILIMTNDGDLTYGLTHPKHEVPKTYVVKVKPVPSKEKLTYLRNGGDIGVYHISPCQISTRVVDGETATYEVTIHEGKNRQIRNMFEFLGCEIVTLKRISIGNLKLKGLRLGKARQLEEDEVKYLKELAEQSKQPVQEKPAKKQKRKR